MDLTKRLNVYVTENEEAGLREVTDVAEFANLRTFTIDIDDLGAFETTVDDNISEFVEPNDEAPATEILTEAQAAQQFISDKLDRKSTVDATRRDVHRFKQYLGGKSVDQEIQDMAPAQLNVHLCGWFRSLRKPDGTAYEPGTLQGKMYSVDR